MKIEKLSDTQIRFTLNSEDLALRHIDLGELAYGSDRAKALFQEMMQKAFHEYGFDVADNPLMVEAIPLSGDSIILVVTKVEDPEELDTRFSKFSPFNEEENGFEEDLLPGLEGADALLKILEQEKAPEEAESRPAAPGVRIFEFSSLDRVSQAARIVSPFFDGVNTLYRDTAGRIFLSVSGAGYTEEEFSRVLNTLGEYGLLTRSTSGREAFLEEHSEKLIEGLALQVMKTL